MNKKGRKIRKEDIPGMSLSCHKIRFDRSNTTALSRPCSNAVSLMKHDSTHMSHLPSQSFAWPMSP